MIHMNTPHTPKPIRVTVPVSPEVLALFQRLSRVSGLSVGKSMGQWLDETRVGLEPMIDIVEKNKTAPKTAVQSLQRYASTLIDLSDDLFDKVRRMDDGETAMADAVAAADRVNQKLSKRGLTPPSSNTGGKGRETPNKSKGGAK